MTSVTLPSTSGLLHGGYSSVAEETTSSEPEFESPRPVKRCLITSLTDSCKKRRKQTTPVRISSTETDTHTEGKPSSRSPEPELQCPVCQLIYTESEELQCHILCEHSVVQFKKESEELDHIENETPLELTSSRDDGQWLDNVQSKEWANSNMRNLPFNPGNPMFMALPAQFTQIENISRQPIRIFNPDAYCDLCNKEFCNKYFLKTHKANKHGIYSDPPSSEALATTVNIAPYTGNIKLPTSVPSVDIPMKNDKSTYMINPFNNIYLNSFSNKAFTKVNKLQSLYENESSENVPNSNGFSSNNESDKLSLDEHLADESSSPRNIQTESTSIKSDSELATYCTQSKLSPGNDMEMSNRLKRIGVMNPKAFCEICCKEYCNKYFLRTHKMKRHGIYIPEEKDRDGKSEDNVNFSWPNNMQTSPLNLIITDQMSADRKTTSPSDISCDSCGIKFQNLSLIQLHNQNVHSKVHTNEDEHQDENECKKKEEYKSVNPEAISEDLQKLQTMISQLNGLDVSKVCKSCTACNKEFETRQMLQTHMITEHGIPLDNISDKPFESDNYKNNVICDLCGKDVQTSEGMKKHLLEFHPNHQENFRDEFNDSFSNLDRNSSRIPPLNNERRVNINVTPTSSYCDICNKELCNKYFMKTHMQRMHGIEIENGAQIGGVICDICNKELCSKYFLRVHKHNTHGIVEYGSGLLNSRKDGENTVAPLPGELDPSPKATDLVDLSHRYFTHFTEVCSICNRRFRSTKWLKAHLLNDHGQAGAEKWSELEQQLQQTITQHSKVTVKSECASPTLKIPNGGQERKEGIQNVLSALLGVDESTTKTYQCSFCPFTTTILPLLFVHERSHSMCSEAASLKCPICAQSFFQLDLLQYHMFTQHPFLPSIFTSTKDIETSKEKEPSESDDEERIKNKGKTKRLELSPEIGQKLKDFAKMVKAPAAYALPQGHENDVGNYVMQAFLIKEVKALDERKFVPAVVFLPVFQNQPTPITVTFTLTPA